MTAALGLDHETGSLVVIQRIRSGPLSRILWDLLTLDVPTHHNVATLIGVFRAPSGATFVVREHVTDSLETLGDVTEPLLRAIVCGTFQGLRHLHRHKLCHGALAPDAILVDFTHRRIMLTYMGIACSASRRYYTSDRDPTMADDVRAALTIIHEIWPDGCVSCEECAPTHPYFTDCTESTLQVQ
jgi:serine/threonine protein kinase